MNMETPFSITREEVLELAAKKLADAFVGDGDLEEYAQSLIRERVTAAFASKLNQRIDEFLCSEMEKIIGQEICPVDMFGEREGKPTTIRATLAERARAFWDVKVNSEGKRECYGGRPRHEVLFEKIVKDEFAKAIKENAEVIVGAFKAALKADAARISTEHIDKLITLRK